MLELLFNTLDAINTGLVLISSEQRLIFLNSWMSRHSQLQHTNIEGLLLVELFPELAHGRIQEAINAALTHNHASILSKTLNKSPFPLFSSPMDRRKGIRMAQAIHIIPIQTTIQAHYCLIQIIDVTLSVARENLLRQQSLLLREQSYFDALTGIANRRRFNEYAEDELLRARRSAAPLAIMMIDVDHFKLYNDYYGHPEGDQCLKKVAKTLENIFKRPADLLARYGGEEFSAILPETNFEGMRKLAEAMLSHIKELNIEHAQSPTVPYITVSIGGTSKIPEPHETIVDFLKIADQSLYHAKQSGRNRFVFALNKTEMFTN